MSCAIGIDLAWKEKGQTGLCVVCDGEIRFWEAAPFTNEQLIEKVLSFREHPCVVAIDAPLEVPNTEGMRSCERAFKKLRIHGHKLSILGSNRQFLEKHFGGVRGEILGKVFQSAGLEVCETFPTASVVGMFGKKVPYKFSAGKTKQGVLTGMWDLVRIMSIHDWFAGHVDIFKTENLPADVRFVSRRELKVLEDQLDALICAHTAWQVMHKPGEVTRIMGEIDDGRIIFSFCGDPLKLKV